MSEKNVIENPVCGACQTNAPDPTYAFPLCRNCREKLINRPFPQWIKIVMIIVVALILYSAFKFPIAFKAGLAKQSAKQAEAAADYALAISEYQKILTLFPDSEEHKALLAVYYIKTGATQQVLPPTLFQPKFSD